MTDGFSPQQRRAISEAARAELARRELLAFCSRCVSEFQPAAHLRQVAELLEAVERGDLKRLIVTIAPGHGKSTLLQAFVSWYLGRDPRRKVIGASAGAELAERNSRASRALFAEDAWPFEATLSSDTRSMTRWATSSGGGLFAIGVDGKITGWRGNVIVCDDLMNSAGTQAERDALWSWFREVLMPRLEPGGSVILVGTRWSEDDIVGRISDSPDGGDWRVVRLPALAEADDPLGRAVGDALWPERWSIEALMKQRTSMGPRAFETQFQARPIPLEGNLIKAEWLQRYAAPPAEFEKVVCALDAAAKTGVRNDYSAIVKIGVTKSSFYLLDVWRAKVEFPALLQRVRMLQDEMPAPATIYVEDTSNAVALIQQLKQETRLPIVPVSAKGSKESRVEANTGVLEAHRVFLPEDAPWLLDFERELLAFPGGKHDDQVDAFSLALSQLSMRSRSWLFVFGVDGDGDGVLEWGDGEIERIAGEPAGAAGSAGSAVARLLS